MKKLYFLLFLSSITSFGQTQIGSNINGVAVGDFSGEKLAISSDGNVVVIGSRLNNQNNTGSGCVSIYRNISNSWVQVGNSIYGQYLYENFGSSVAISFDGSVIAIGAPGNNLNGNASGAVFVYQNISNNWVLVGQPICGIGIGYRSGRSVSMSADGTTIAIAAQGNNQNGSVNGQVRIFKNILNSWTQVGQDMNGLNSGDAIGYEVTLSNDGSIVAISSIDNDANGESSGQVRVFQNIADVWTQKGQNLNGNSEGDMFGRNLSLSSLGNFLIVGATGVDINVSGNNNGAISVYKFESNAWTQIGNTILGENFYEGFGWGVTISDDGNIIAGGGPSAFNNKGVVRIYKNISNSWYQIGSHLIGDSFGDNFGNYIDLSADGTKLSVGAWGCDTNGSNSGQVKIYDLSTLLNNDTFVLDNFSVYPNPTSEILNITLENNLTLEKVNIYSTSGQFIKSDNKSQINISSLAKGTYFVEVITNQGKATKTIIVE